MVKCHNNNNDLSELLGKVYSNWIILLESNDKFVNDSVLDQIRHRANKPNDIVFWNVSNDTNTVDKSRTYGQCFHASYKQNFYNNGKSVVEGEYIKRLSLNKNINQKIINRVVIVKQQVNFNNISTTSNVITVFSALNSNNGTHKYHSSKIYKDMGFEYMLTSISKTKFLNYQTVIIDGVTSNADTFLRKLHKKKHINWINTIYLIDNQDQQEYLKKYEKWGEPVYTDNLFIYNEFKYVFPIFLALPLIKFTNVDKYNKITIFLDCKRINITNNKKQIILQLKKNYDMHIIKLDSNTIVDNYDNLFENSSVLLYVDDDFNKYRGSKKIIDALIQNKIIILQNIETYITKMLKYIRYPNYILFNDYTELDNIIANISINKIKYFDFSILHNKFVYYTNIMEDINKYKNMINIHNKTVILLGNGPSAKDVDFKKLSFPTIGMNVAYRYWEKIDWYPDIYCCLDVELIKSHFNNILHMIQQNKCHHYFLRKKFKDLCKENNIDIIQTNIYYLEEMEHILFESNKHITTGAYSLRFALFLGYTDIRLIGIDSNYVNFVTNSKKKNTIKTSTALEITENAASVNYFYSDYQKKGDVYNIPNVDKQFVCNCKYCGGTITNHKDLHNMVFDFVIIDIKTIKQYNNISIKNYSTISNLNQFVKNDLKLIYK
jgi:hypothetical protein